MLQLQKGKYFGAQNHTVNLNGLIITDTEYTHDRVDWHTHQNPYFTFIIEGNMLEANKKESYQCGPGTLLFHNWQDAHYNIKPPGYTRGFHIETESSFFERYDVPQNKVEGSLMLDSPVFKALFRQMFVSANINDSIRDIAIEESLINVFNILSGLKNYAGAGIPAWVKKVKEALHDINADALTWEGLSRTAGVHPVHLSRDFPRYFHTTVGDYLRKLRIEQAINLLRDNAISITTIAYQCGAYQCGFADQSHFIRTFKTATGITPLQYRKNFSAR
jgi:AraC family transcriptional regulator